jgi:hypothetical protein
LCAPWSGWWEWPWFGAPVFFAPYGQTEFEDEENIMGIGYQELLIVFALLLLFGVPFLVWQIVKRGKL